MNVTALRAGIFTAAPVCGLRPTRASLLETLNVPNPINVILSPFFNAPVIASNVASIAFKASDFVNPELLLILLFSLCSSFISEYY